jgi:hypothetical protein
VVIRKRLEPFSNMIELSKLNKGIYLFIVWFCGVFP